MNIQMLLSPKEQFQDAAQATLSNIIISVSNERDILLNRVLELEDALATATRLNDELQQKLTTAKLMLTSVEQSLDNTVEMARELEARIRQLESS